MIILGLDPSTKTGWALFDTSKPVQAIRAGVLKAGDGETEFQAAQLGRALRDLIKAEGKPSLVVIEAPMRMLPMVKRARKTARVDMLGDADESSPSGMPQGLGAALTSNQMVGALMGIIGACGLPCVVLTSGEWRKSFLGYGRKPGFDRKAWKQAVRHQCDLEGIRVTNDDMADAVGIAIAGRNTQTARALQARAA